jgi:hypothetical protein
MMETWNTKVVKRNQSSVTVDVHGKWVNYLDELGKWRPIDTTIVEKAGAYEVTKAPFLCYFPKTSTDECQFLANNRYSPLRKEINQASGLSLYFRPIGINRVNGIVEGDQIVFPDAYAPGVDYIVRCYHGKVPRIRKLFRTDRAPANDVRLEYELRFPGVNDLIEKVESDEFSQWDGSEIKITRRVKIYAENHTRGIHFKRPEIWDSAGNRAFLDAYIRIENGKLILSKAIPARLFNYAVFPVYSDTDFYPDPDAESTSVDGHVGRHNVTESWSTLRAGAGTTSDDSAATTYVARCYSAAAAGTWRDLYRGILLFDKSSLGLDQIITNVDLKLYCETLSDGGNLSAAEQSIHIVSSDPASNTALENSDYADLGETTYGETEWADITDEQYYTTTFNSAGRAVVYGNDIVKLGTRFEADLSDSEPTKGTEQVTQHKIYSADTAGTSKDPVLVVTACHVGKRLISVA